MLLRILIAVLIVVFVRFVLVVVRALAGQGRDFLLVTQNIDTLHEQAGARRMVKVHGTSDRVRCARYGCEHGAKSSTGAFVVSRCRQSAPV